MSINANDSLSSVFDYSDDKLWWEKKSILLNLGVNPHQSVRFKSYDAPMLNSKCLKLFREKSWENLDFLWALMKKKSNHHLDHFDNQEWKLFFFSFFTITDFFFWQLKFFISTLHKKRKNRKRKWRQETRKFDIIF